MSCRFKSERDARLEVCRLRDVLAAAKMERGRVSWYPGTRRVSPYLAASPLGVLVGLFTGVGVVMLTLCVTNWIVRLLTWTAGAIGCSVLWLACLPPVWVLPLLGLEMLFLGMVGQGSWTAWAIVLAGSRGVNRNERAAMLTSASGSLCSFFLGSLVLSEAGRRFFQGSFAGAIVELVADIPLLAYGWLIVGGLIVCCCSAIGADEALRFLGAGPFCNRCQSTMTKTELISCSWERVPRLGHCCEVHGKWTGLDWDRVFRFWMYHCSKCREGNLLGELVLKAEWARRGVFGRAVQESLFEEWMFSNLAIQAERIDSLVEFSRARSEFV